MHLNTLKTGLKAPSEAKDRPESESQVTQGKVARRISCETARRERR